VSKGERELRGREWMWEEVNWTDEEMRKKELERRRER
jgi:hypothetical protein